ncbi:phosphotransferase [Streptomyces sp. SCUT-3]|uniref:aminoglycoside phosphotransferase family protein n=1 Tax=Streptomyces sp. SCUT-3 TaxID=2684469 RepID=UPI000CBF1681|nr:aminoglycoside phosphotransferase family protein [Streptomyces sp. SCUT-3]PLW65689.1 aminoglycoside phosphotransferase family protein [Streptomyces sp. DJ]QMV23497.1 phosphotransferase [Streptomyces sp. SCUT-3]
MVRMRQNPSGSAFGAGVLTDVRASRAADEYGPFGAAVVKPFSITRRTHDGKALLKTYRVIEPGARRDREVEALTLASEWGLAVPDVLAAGEDGDRAWALLSVVPGKPSAISTNADVEAFVARAMAIGAVLHRAVPDATSGTGWGRRRDSEAATSHSGFLLSQLSPRCREQPWWEDLNGHLHQIDQLPTVYLHGDIKPDHLLVDGETLHVVDWEASSRGPAACDHADIVFHLVRDLAYSAVGLRDLPADAIGRVPSVGPILAWRIALWLDRRRPQDIDALSSSDLNQLAHAPAGADAVLAVGRVVAACRNRGTPR